jgi:PAS domain S-box-containing protein
MKLEALRNELVELENALPDRRAVQEALRMSEEGFAVIFDKLGDGLLLADRESRKFLMGNSTIQRILGFSAEELNGLGIADIHRERDLPWVIDRFEELAKKEIEIARDIPVRRKDGSVFYADISCSFPMVSGGKEYLMAVFRDISERRQAEEALRESEARYRNIFENATEGIFQSTPEGRYLNVNPAFARLMGFASPEEMMEHISAINRSFKRDRSLITNWSFE